MIMKIKSSHLEAFFAVARVLNFTRAAASVHITQSALSQRIAHLEEDLETTLFVRGKKAVRLTEAGQKLLRYCQTNEIAETELLAHLKNSQDGYGGILRLAGFSSVNRSLVLPSLAPLMRKNKNLSIHVMTKEIFELEGLLRRAEVDYIISSQASKSAVRLPPKFRPFVT